MATTKHTRAHKARKSNKTERPASAEQIDALLNDGSDTRVRKARPHPTKDTPPKFIQQGTDALHARREDERLFWVCASSGIAIGKLLAELDADFLKIHRGIDVAVYALLQQDCDVNVGVVDVLNEHVLKILNKTHADTLNRLRVALGLPEDFTSHWC